MTYEAKKRLVMKTLELTPEQFEAMTQRDQHNERLNKLVKIAINEMSDQLDEAAASIL